MDVLISRKYGIPKQGEEGERKISVKIRVFFTDLTEGEHFFIHKSTTLYIYIYRHICILYTLKRHFHKQIFL